jgi:hypothetical protein
MALKQKAAVKGIMLVGFSRGALKLKLDDKGFAVLKDGMPVYIDDKDNKEFAFDAEQMYGKIGTLNTESKNHRLRAEAAEANLLKYGDAKPEDVEKFLQTLEDLGGPDGIAQLQKKAGIDVDALKRSMNDAFDANKKAVIDGYEKKLADAGKELSTKDASIYKLMVSGQLATSKFVQEQLILPPDIVEKTFGSSFKVEDGQVVAYLGNERILSRERPGEIAGVDEALATLVEHYPMKDRILKSKQAPGSGAGDGGGGNNTFAGLKRSAMTDPQKSEFITKNGQDAFRALPL